MAFDLQVIAENLKGERVHTLLQSARKLAEDREYANARALLLQAQRIDPRNVDAKALAVEVQERMNELQRSEQLRQLVEQAQSALEARRWEDAALFFEQAQGLDTEDTYDISRRLREVQEEKEQQQKLVALWEQASDARRRGDLTGAQELLSEALRIDARSTDLRNAYSVVVREIRRKQEAARVADLLRGARESYTMRRYTEAIAQLREATGIDPGHPEVQELLFTATTKDKEERRQHLLDKLALEIQESLDREDFVQAEDRFTRALETLPGEPVLLRLQEEMLRSRTEQEQAEIVRAVMLQSQELFADDPKRAMESIDDGLARAPANPTLLQVRSLLQRHLQEKETETQPEGVAEPRMAAGEPASEAARVTAGSVTATPPAVATASAARAANASQNTSSSRLSSRLLYPGVALVSVVLVLSAVLVLRTRHSHAAAAPPSVADRVSVPSAPKAQHPAEATTQFDFELDASPWATVVSVVDAAGKSLPLPPGGEVTPVRLNGVNAGTYTVHLHGAQDGQEKTVQCTVSERQHLCTADMGLPDMQQLLKGERP
jgi:serine/threonine-protein kinase